LRAQVNEYLLRILPTDPKAKKKDIETAMSLVVDKFPEVIDYYIQIKEEEGKEATEVAEKRVAEVKTLFVEQINQLVNEYLKPIGFYNSSENTYSEAKEKVLFLKHVIENQGGYRFFYVNGKPVERETDLQILYRLTWFSNPYDLSREGNDGDGLIDFQVSCGKKDKTLVEFKLAKNPKLENYLAKQSEIHENSSESMHPLLKVIMFFSTSEFNRVNQILERLKLQDYPHIILIDARNDNKVTTNYTCMNYQDFQILVDKNNNIRADSEQGEVSDELHLNKNEIKLTLKLIEFGQTDRELLKTLGNTLYQALFPNNINARFHATIASAAAKNYSVRLRLIFQSPELAALPWEFLYDEGTNTFLGNNTQTVLSRYVDVPLQKRDIKSASLPLKVLLVISSPSKLTKLDASGEEKFIREALAKHLEAGQIELDVLQIATIRNISQKLREKPYNIFHFIGHGEFEDDKGYIILVNENGEAKSLDDERFANLFLGGSNVGLVILNSCKGATVSTNQAFAGTAPNLVRRGIPAVIAMQYTITDVTSKLFADEFYRTLALGYPVDAAIQTTRNAISIEVGLEKCDFATPVLYMRAKNGVIF
jgi:CHAT domain